TSSLAWFLLAFSGPLWARLSVSTTQGSSPCVRSQEDAYRAQPRTRLAWSRACGPMHDRTPDERPRSTRDKTGEGPEHYEVSTAGELPGRSRRSALRRL